MTTEQNFMTMAQEDSGTLGQAVGRHEVQQAMQRAFAFVGDGGGASGGSTERIRPNAYPNGKPHETYSTDGQRVRVTWRRGSGGQREVPGV